MSRSLFVFLSLFCMFGWVSMGQCAFSDEVSLLQEHTHALPQDKKWPNINKIIDSVKDAVKKINNKTHDELDKAAAATSSAMQTVVQGLMGSLNGILDQSERFDDYLKKEVDGFVGRVHVRPRLQTFVENANHTLDHFGAFLYPFATVFNLSIETTKKIVSASGADVLSDEVGTALTIAMGALTKADLTKIKVQQKLGDLNAKVDETVDSISSEAKEDLGFIIKELNDLSQCVNETFVNKTLDAYTGMLSALREGMKGVLDVMPKEPLEQVNDAINSIPPVVTNINENVANAIHGLSTGFDDASTHVIDAADAALSSDTSK